jgi:hypothetical protein
MTSLKRASEIIARVETRKRLKAEKRALEWKEQDRIRDEQIDAQLTKYFAELFAEDNEELDFPYVFNYFDLYERGISGGFTNIIERMKIVIQKYDDDDNKFIVKAEGARGEITRVQNVVIDDEH